MDFLVEFLRTSFNFIFLIAVAVGGVCLGKFARDKKDKKN